MSAPKCDVCGRFSKIVDAYTPFGSTCSIEPPDDVLLCQSCVERMKESHRKIEYMPCNWHPAKYESELAKEMGYVWESQNGCAWGQWIKTQIELEVE